MGSRLLVLPAVTAGLVMAAASVHGGGQPAAGPGQTRCAGRDSPIADHGGPAAGPGRGAYQR